MLISDTAVFGFEAAFRGLRNPKNSWDRADSTFGYRYTDYDEWKGVSGTTLEDIDCQEMPMIGPRDLHLASSLIRAGDEHGKFARQIAVWVDFTLPLFVWSEFDTYKVGVVRNSCSTMHKLGSRPLTQDDFEGASIDTEVLYKLNYHGEAYRKEPERVDILIAMKSMLPCSYLQKATLSMNYQVLRSIFRQRKNHRLPQWNLDAASGIFSICKWIKSLPYSAELIAAGCTNE